MRKNNFHRIFGLFEKALPNLTAKRGNHLNARYKVKGLLPEHEIFIKVIHNWRGKLPHKKGQFKSYYIDLNFYLKKKGKKFDQLYHEQFYIKHSSEGYFIEKWYSAENEKIIHFQNLDELIENVCLEFKRWLNQLNNYKYALLVGENIGYRQSAAWFTNEIHQDNEGDLICSYISLWNDANDVRITSAHKMKPHLAIQTFESIATGLTKIESSYLSASYIIDGFLPEHSVYIGVGYGENGDKGGISDFGVNYNLHINHKGEYFDAVFDMDTFIKHSEMGYYCKDCHHFLKNKKNPSPLPYFITVEEVLISDLSVFVEYLNSLKDYKYVTLNGLKKNSGATFASLKKEKDPVSRKYTDFMVKPLWKGIKV